MECLCCFNEMNEFVKYRDKEEGEWKISPYCEECIRYMLKIQFQNYVDEVKNETCKVSLERLIKLGPPKKFRDPKVPCENDGNEVYEFSFGLSNVDYNEEQMNEITEYINLLKF